MISTSDIREWLLSSPSTGTHMLVIWDSFDDSHYPIYIIPDGRPPKFRIQEEIAKYAAEGDHLHPNLMVLMEVYDLSLDLELQLSEYRAMHINANLSI